MIRLWLSRAAAIPLREQLSAQLLFGIVSRRIAPGEKLPSVRELARRLKVHPNTVSAVYRDLDARGWLRHRRGSGVFVREFTLPATDAGADAFARAWVQDGLARGFRLDELQDAFERIIHESQKSGPWNLLVIHPDRELAGILAAEIEMAINAKISFAGDADVSADLEPDTCVLVTATCAAAVLAKVRPAHYCVIGLNAIEQVIAGQGGGKADLLIAVVSRSVSILQWSSRLLSALGVPVTDVLKRDPAQPGWQEGLKICDIVAADVKAARELPPGVKPTVFRIVSEKFLAEARRLVTAEKL